MLLKIYFFIVRYKKPPITPKGKIPKGFNMNRIALYEVHGKGKQVVKLYYNPEGVKQKLLNPL